MNDEQRRKELRRWAVELALKLEYPIADFKDKQKPKNATIAIFSNPYLRRSNEILQQANMIYEFVETYEDRKFMNFLLKENSVKWSKKKIA